MVNPVSKLPKNENNSTGITAAIVTCKALEKWILSVNFWILEIIKKGFQTKVRIVGFIQRIIDGDLEETIKISELSKWNYSLSIFLLFLPTEFKNIFL